MPNAETASILTGNTMLLAGCVVVFIAAIVGLEWLVDRFVQRCSGPPIKELELKPGWLALWALVWNAGLLLGFWLWGEKAFWIAFATFPLILFVRYRLRHHATLRRKFYHNAPVEHDELK